MPAEPPGGLVAWLEAMDRDDRAAQTLEFVRVQLYTKVGMGSKTVYNTTTTTTTINL
jgi:hypothetical protein